MYSKAKEIVFCSWKQYIRKSFSAKAATLQPVHVHVHVHILFSGE
jgi:hypothetical protein